MADHDPDRDYVKEALAILSGVSSLLPERQHLAALAKHAEESITNTLLISRILAVVMLDIEQEKLPIPGDALKEAADRGVYLQIERVGTTEHRLVTLKFRNRTTAAGVTIN